jgi:hypothetical protein
MEITREDLYKLSKRDRARLNAYINLLLITQKIPALHDAIKCLGNWAFYRI